MKHLQADERGVILACPSCGQANRLPYQRLRGEPRCASCKEALPAPAAPVEIPDGTAFSALVGGSALPVFIDFWAPWCGPCRMVAPEVDKLAELTAGDVLVCKLNTEDVQDVAAALRVHSIPTFALFHLGRERHRFSGAMGAQQLLATIQQVLG